MKSKLTRANIKGFIQGWSRKLFGVDMPLHVEEQIQYRLTVKRKECKKACQHCGCEFPEKAFEDRGCEHPNPCYPEMMNETEWLTYKKEHKIDEVFYF